MSLRRFFVPPALIRDGIAILPAGSAHHLRHVLRLDSGTRVEVFDGEGRAWAGQVEFSGTEVRIVLQEPLTVPGDTGPHITLALALIRPERFEWALEKSTELGVAAIVPLDTRYSEVRIPVAKVPAKLERWRRITREAARQCERATVPLIWAPMSPADLFQLPEVAGSRKLWFHERTGEQERFPSADAPLVVCIGPEGGWHADETEAARMVGCSIVTLGRRILRSETAAVAALAVLQCGREGVKPS
jgi:16S rRNA (uracil1498-N3)-methyltransferase